MSSFTNFSAKLSVCFDPEASKILNKDYWRVTKGFRYYVGSVGSGCFVDVPRGFLTDGASVPRILWSILPPWGDYGQAAVLHDWLCENMTIQVTRSDGSVVSQKIDRKQVDGILCEAMTVLGVKSWEHKAIDAAVGAYRVVMNPTKPKVAEAKRKLELAYAA